MLLVTLEQRFSSLEVWQQFQANIYINYALTIPSKKFKYKSERKSTTVFVLFFCNPFLIHPHYQVNTFGECINQGHSCQ